MPESRPSFSARIVDWQRQHGRHHLPWQQSTDAYRVWLSEIMLQQTQVATVIPYYERFLARFPTVAALAAAPDGEVMALWAGLGYYTRARNLHACAIAVMRDHGGVFPTDAATLQTLPGIGRSTAAAIAAFSSGERGAILDGNVRRVLARWAGIEGWTGAPAVEARLWTLANSLLPPPAPGAIESYTQGLMDLGATVCTRGKPGCDACPLAADCVALRDGRTASLPSPRPKKAVPTRAAAMLIALHGDEVLLERRPPSGIWGGLWTLPEFADAPALATALARLDADAVARPLAPREHQFTHFKLSFVPMLARLVRKPTVAAEPGQLWLALADAADAALPTPVKRVLLDLHASERGGLFGSE
ncbi:A/G-specific adenine glycosylase [Derxia lacustris]|uniref:A/G-specific adenine glycosylase n=1 Tax=Derxia lacustris TaxID=764842 RepID=UPI000A172241|nr:A/G-specific adenine glycosylase [Derxia lacustris]